MEARLPVDDEGRAQANPARRAVAAVEDALHQRLNLDVAKKDVRVTLRCRAREKATCAAPRRLAGVESEATVLYYDAYGTERISPGFAVSFKRAA